jgi:U3 small nucleolar RNA-associated protein 10
MQTKEANAKLDASITSFLRLLSNYLLLPPAHQALEFLIRRYMVSF